MLKRCRRSPSVVCVEERWAVIEEAVRCIFEERPSPYSFQFIYQIVFQLCRENAENLILERLDKLFVSQCTNIRSELLSVPSDQLLETFVSCSVAFTNSLHRVADVFIYVDQFRVPRAESRRVVALGERALRVSVVSASPISERLIGAFIEQLQHASCAVSLLEQYSALMRRINHAKLYCTLVEAPCIDTLRQCFVSRIAEWRRTMSLSSFLEVVKEDIRAQCSSMRGVLHDDPSINKLNIALCNAFVECCSDLFVGERGGFTRLLESGEMQSLLILAELYHNAGDASCVPTALSLSLCAKLKATLDLEVGDPAGMCATVRSVLAVYRKLDVLRQCLGHLIGSKVALIERDLGDVLNHSRTYLECLCVYVDAQLRQHDLDDNMCRDLTALMRLVRDRESLEGAIRNRIALRLIATRPHALVGENKVIYCLKESCGATMVEKLEHMMSDVQDNSTHEHLLAVIAADGIRLPLDFHVAVLTEGFWPHFPSFSLDFPSDMTTCMRVFEHYYLARHNGRRLAFHGALGTVLYLFRHGTRTYQVTAQTLMVPAIEALNKDEPISTAELSARTSLAEGEVKCQMEALMAAQLVVRRGDAFYFNDSFQSERASIRIAAVTHKVARQSYDEQATHSPFTSSRSKSVDAAIIKLLKSYRSIDFNTLCQCVIEMLQPSFSPTVAYIKTRLEQLVEKNYATGGGRSGRYFYCE